MYHRKPSAVAWSVLISVALAGSASVAEEREDPQGPKKKPAREEKPASEDAAPSRYDAATSRRRPAPDDVITNEDLERMEETPPGQMPSWVGEAVPAPTPRPKPRSEPRPKPPRAALPGNGKTAPVARAPQASPRSPKTQNEMDAERKVAALEARVADLERAVLAARNPHLPREWARPASDAQLRQARVELSRARQELARWRGEEP
jgi:hypothetical protein